MSGTGALRQFVPKAVRLVAFGYPALALGQTALAAHDEAFGTNMRASSLRAALPRTRRA
jgi:hypothetical protein